jgi:hypothetical protein
MGRNQPVAGSRRMKWARHAPCHPGFWAYPAQPGELTLLSPTRAHRLQRPHERSKARKSGPRTSSPGDYHEVNAGPRGRLTAGLGDAGRSTQLGPDRGDPLSTRTLTTQCSCAPKLFCGLVGKKDKGRFEDEDKSPCKTGMRPMHEPASREGRWLHGRVTTERFVRGDAAL